MTALLYHDVLRDPRNPDSGFPGADANIYKLSEAAFERHLSAIGGSGAAVFAGPAETLGSVVRRPEIVILTFDDGGVSGWPVTSDCLARRGWRGVFFVTTGYIGTPGFLSADAIRGLVKEGHVVGSHSVSHPARMAALTPDELRHEWAESRATLENILGSKVTCGSIPGGYYSESVAEAAAAAGYRLVFTSEPRRRPWDRGEVQLAGRFSVVRNTPANLAAALGQGRILACARQSALWNVKKVAKRLGGRGWLEFRKRYWAWRAEDRGSSQTM